MQLQLADFDFIDWLNVQLRITDDVVDYLWVIATNDNFAWWM